MVVALEAHVVGRVEGEDHELDAERRGAKHVGYLPRQTGRVGDDGGEGEEEEEEGDG